MTNIDLTKLTCDTAEIDAPLKVANNTLSSDELKINSETTISCDNLKYKSLIMQRGYQEVEINSYIDNIEWDENIWLLDCSLILMFEKDYRLYQIPIKILYDGNDLVYVAPECSSLFGDSVGFIWGTKNDNKILDPANMKVYNSNNSSMKSLSKDKVTKKIFVFTASKLN